eukprot:scaffold5374_cov149-Skeletonema_menzelii.AAC.7
MSDDESNPHIMATLESLMRITIAGFGGALAGISISRRGGGLAASAQQAQTLAKKVTASTNNVIQQSRTQRRQAIRSAPPVLRPSIDRELPSAWAFACMAFAGVVEFTRLVSPTTFVSQFITPPLKIESGDDIQVESVPEDNNDRIVTSILDPFKYGSTIIDYMIGGAMAGALFKGSAVRTPTGARLDASIMGNYSASSVSTAMKGKPLSGILPGAALGLIAGVSIVSLEYANIVIEEKFGVEEDNNTDDITEVAPKEINDDIPADIKAMTSEELAASIQSLRSGIVESKEEERVEDKSQEEQSNATKEKATDLLYSIGFRPHQS